MKKLELREFKTEIADASGKTQEVVITYKELIEGALNYVPANDFGQSLGVPVDNMRVRIRVLDKLDTDEKEVSLDDEDVKTIFECVKAQKFIRIDKGLVEYFDYIKELDESKGE